MRPILSEVPNDSVAPIEVASWWAKHDRAREHLSQLQTELDRLETTRVYTEQIETASEAAKARFSTIVGDIVHNLRLSLEHCAFAVARPQHRHRAGFPIFMHDYWRNDARGVFIRTDMAGVRGRESFDRLTRAYPLKAVTYLHSIQPYRAPEPEREPLALLGRLESTDKHRQLSVTPLAFNATLSLYVSGVSLPAMETLAGIAGTVAAVLTELERFVEERPEPDDPSLGVDDLS